jgi:Glycosyl-transferase for dystroglycan
MSVSIYGVHPPGPISVTIHVPLSSLSTLQDLHALYTSSPSFSTYVDVHLVLSPFYNSEGSRQFNAWRNLARMFAKTEFVMMLDVDFVPCTDFRGFLRRALKDSQDNGMVMDQPEKDFMDRLRDGTAALVIPAFEYAKQADGVDQSRFPTDKSVSPSSSIIENSSLS